MRNCIVMLNKMGVPIWEETILKAMQVTEKMGEVEILGAEEMLRSGMREILHDEDMLINAMEDY